MIGSSALYMACVTGNVSNMKIPAAMNAVSIAGYIPGSDRGDVISIIAVAAFTVVTTCIVFLGMLFPYIKQFPKESILPILLPIVLILIVGRGFFSTNQSYLMIGVIVLSAVYS